MEEAVPLIVRHRPHLRTRGNVYCEGKPHVRTSPRCGRPSFEDEPHLRTRGNFYARRASCEDEPHLRTRENVYCEDVSHVRTSLM